MRRFLLASFLLLAPSLAFADAPKDVKKMTTDDCAKARAANKTCVISIEGIDLEGGVKGPGGERIDILKHGDHASLIRLRFDFIPEILKTAEDL
jgi:hypothetical protein